MFREIGSGNIQLLVSHCREFSKVSFIHSFSKQVNSGQRSIHSIWSTTDARNCEPQSAGAVKMRPHTGCGFKSSTEWAILCWNNSFRGNVSTCDEGLGVWRVGHCRWVPETALSLPCNWLAFHWRPMGWFLMRCCCSRALQQDNATPKGECLPLMRCSPRHPSYLLRCIRLPIVNISTLSSSCSLAKLLAANAQCQSWGLRCEVTNHLYQHYTGTAPLQ